MTGDWGAARTADPGGTVSEAVGLIVAHDRKLAAQIVKALEHAGIRDVEFWPEHMLRPSKA